MVALGNPPAFSLLYPLNPGPPSFSLHPCALNPEMDVLILHRILTAEEYEASKAPLTYGQKNAENIAKMRASRAEQDVTEKLTEEGWKIKDKGKGKEPMAADKREDGELGRVILSLWRCAGGMVWEKQIPGNALLGLVWSVDGRMISVLIDTSLPSTSDTPGTSQRIRLAHLSLHTGDTLHSQILPSSSTALSKLDEMNMVWLQKEVDGDKWPEDAPGSAGVIIDSIAAPNPIEPWSFAEQVQSLNLQSIPAAFSIPSPSTSSTFSSTTVLSTFPSLTASASPYILHIPSLGLSLLGGTFDFPRLPTPSYHSIENNPSQDGFVLLLSPESIPSSKELSFAKSVQRLKEALKVCVDGFELVGKIWKEGVQVEAGGWIGELKECARDSGATFASAQADMVRLLMTGKCGDAISQFVGGKLTNNNLHRWHLTYNASMARISRILMTSIWPNCERILLILDEMLGWSMYKPASSLCIPKERLKNCIKQVQSFSIKVAEAERAAQEEAKRFREFVKWMKYEIGRSTSAHGEEELEILATHDVLLVCDYLDSTFSKSHLSSYFWSAEHMEMIDWQSDILPASNSSSSLKSQNIARGTSAFDILSKTLSRLKDRSLEDGQTSGIEPPRDPGDVSALFAPIIRDNSVEQDTELPGMASMTDMDMSMSMDQTNMGIQLPAVETTTSTPKPVTETSRTTTNALWPLVFKIIEAIQEIVEESLPYPMSKQEEDSERSHGFVILRYSSDASKTLTVVQPSSLNQACLSVINSTAHAASTSQTLSLEHYGPETKLLSVQFYVKDCLAMLLATPVSPAKYNLYLGFIDLEPSDVEDRKPAEPAVKPVSLTRSRLVGKILPDEVVGLATNGREGRRVACVLHNKGTQLDVFDMDEDEGEDEGDYIAENEADEKGAVDEIDMK